MDKKIFSILMGTVLILMSCFSVPVYAEDNTNIVDCSRHTYSFAEMQEDIALLAEKYPDRIEVSSMGTSVDGRAIYQIILGNKNAKNAIYMQAAIHGREWMNSWILMESLETCLDNWNLTAPNGLTYGEVFNNCAIYLLPMVNPDGVTISQYGIDALCNEAVRNNCRNMPGAGRPSKWKANANGVDLNRQFSTGWGNKVDTLVPSSENYNGLTAFTEPEAIAVKNALEQRKFIAGVAYHSMEGAIYWDLGQDQKVREQALALATHCHNISGYRIGGASYTRGLEYNYMNCEKKIPTVCIETGVVPCPLPYSQWKRLWRENHMMMVTLAGCYQ